MVQSPVISCRVSTHPKARTTQLMPRADGCAQALVAAVGCNWVSSELPLGTAVPGKSCTPMVGVGQHPIVTPVSGPLKIEHRY